jgi:hypothetical protein
MRYFLLSAFLSLLAACTPADEMAPTIQLVSPAEGDTHTTGNDLTVTALFSDDRDLMQYSIVLDMPGSDGMEQVDMLQPLFFARTWGISGRDFDATQPIEVPTATAAGQYSLRVWCVDRSGNESPRETITFTMQHATDQTDPALTVNVLTATGPNIVAPGANLRVTGTATDNQALGGLFARLFESGSSNIVASRNQNLQGPTDFFDFNLKVPNATGNYLLVLSLADFSNNRQTRSYPITVQ